MDNVILLKTPEKKRGSEDALRRFLQERRKLALSGHDPDEVLYQLGRFIMLLSMEVGNPAPSRNQGGKYDISK